MSVVVGTRKKLVRLEAAWDQKSPLQNVGAQNWNEGKSAKKPISGWEGVQGELCNTRPGTAHLGNYGGTIVQSGKTRKDLVRGRG